MKPLAITLALLIAATACGTTPEPQAAEGILECEREPIKYAYGPGVRSLSKATQLCQRASNPPTPPATSAPQLPLGQANAVRSAENYLSFTHFSRSGLIKQLSSEFGDGYATGDATAAVDSLVIDWDAQAVGKAREYLDLSGFSCLGLVNQLASDAEGFTYEQAKHGATEIGLC